MGELEMVAATHTSAAVMANAMTRELSSVVKKVRINGCATNTKNAAMVTAVTIPSVVILLDA
jgi:hypothetical protein